MNARNSSTKYDLNEVIFTDFIPKGIDVREIKQDKYVQLRSNKLVVLWVN